MNDIRSIIIGSLQTHNIVLNKKTRNEIFNKPRTMLITKFLIDTDSIEILKRTSKIKKEHCKYAIVMEKVEIFEILIKKILLSPGYELYSFLYELLTLSFQCKKAEFCERILSLIRTHKSTDYNTPNIIISSIIKSPLYGAMCRNKDLYRKFEYMLIHADILPKYGQEFCDFCKSAIKYNNIFALSHALKMIDTGARGVGYCEYTIESLIKDAISMDRPKVILFCLEKIGVHNHYVVMIFEHALKKEYYNIITALLVKVKFNMHIDEQIVGVYCRFGKMNIKNIKKTFTKELYRYVSGFLNRDIPPKVRKFLITEQITYHKRHTSKNQ
jgi:hypothetical protein